MSNVNTLWVPLPPSANAMWVRTRRGMRLSDKYVAWRDQASVIVRSYPKGQPIVGPVALEMLIFKGKGWSNRRHDIDNFVKPTIDFLVKENYFPDDHSEIVRSISILMAPKPDKQAGIWIRIKPHSYEG